MEETIILSSIFVTTKVFLPAWFNDEPKEYASLSSIITKRSWKLLFSIIVIFPNCALNRLISSSDSFDFGKLGIRYNIGESSNMFTDERYVPASFVELRKDIHLDSSHTGKSLQLLAIDNDIEILYVKMESLNP